MKKFFTYTFAVALVIAAVSTFFITDLLYFVGVLFVLTICGVGLQICDR